MPCSCYFKKVYCDPLLDHDQAAIKTVSCVCVRVSLTWSVFTCRFRLNHGVDNVIGVLWLARPACPANGVKQMNCLQFERFI